MESKAPNLAGVLIKTDDESFDCSLDFSPWIASGDTISSEEVKAYQGTTDVTATLIGSSSNDGDSTVTFNVRAGTPNTVYLIEIKATTANADIWMGQLKLEVNGR